MKYNQITAYSVRHRWFPRLFERLQTKNFAAVVFLENNCILQHTWAELLHTVTKQGPAKDIFWLGFRKLWPHLTENDPKHRLRKKVQGAKCIVFRKAGVQRVWDALVQNDGYWHYDMMLSVRLAQRNVFLPTTPMCGYRKHRSVCGMGNKGSKPIQRTRFLPVKKKFHEEPQEFKSGRETRGVLTWVQRKPRCRVTPDPALWFERGSIIHRENDLKRKSLRFRNLGSMA